MQLFAKFCRWIFKTGEYAKSRGITQSEDEKFLSDFKKEVMYISLFAVLGLIGAGYYFGSPQPFIWNAFSRNFAMFNGNKCGTAVIVGIVAYLYIVLWRVQYFYREKNSRRGREHGSSKLMTVADMPKFRAGFFFDPKIVAECKGFEKAGANTFFDDIELKKRMRDTSSCEKELQKNPIVPFEKLMDAKNVLNSPTYQCFLNSQIMAQDVYLSMNCKFINRNLNTITIGGSGQGKSFSELFPNVMMANSNYVITDPSGEILQKCGKFLMTQGYSIKVFNIKDFDMSMRYNPLMYINDDSDINVVVDALNKNIDGDKPKSGGANDFFEKAQRSLTSALFSALRELYPNNPEKQTLFNVMQLLRMAEQKTDPLTGEQYSELDEFFEELKMKNARSYAVKMYENFKVGGPKVCGSVIISATAVFGRYFDNDAMARLTEADDLNLYDFVTGVDENGKPLKCALFLIIPQDTSTYNFLVSMIYSQLFSIVTKGGEKWRLQHNLDNPALPRHLSFWLDEFANIGKIPNFLEILSVVRKYNISINIIVQALSQLKGLYKDDYETIIGNCDTMVYLGGQEGSTIKMLVEKLGKETIKTHSTSVQGGKSASGSMSAQTTGREVLTGSEIEQIARAYELVFITGCKPFKARKYDLTKHPNYNFFGEAKPENNLNITEFNYLLPDLVRDNTPLYREIPMWYGTGKYDEAGVEIKRLESRKEKLLTERERIIRIDDNTIDNADILSAVKNLEDVVYNTAKKCRVAKEQWQAVLEKKKKQDRIKADLQKKLRQGQAFEDDVAKAEETYQELSKEEVQRHIKYLEYYLADLERSLNKPNIADDVKSKHTADYKKTEKELETLRQNLNSKEAGAKEESQIKPNVDLRSLGKNLKDESKTLPKEVREERKKALDIIDKTELTKNSADMILKGSITGFDAFAPYDTEDERIFAVPKKEK